MNAVRCGFGGASVMATDGCGRHVKSVHIISTRKVAERSKGIINMLLATLRGGRFQNDLT
jgi:hypothetical protein